MVGRSAKRKVEWKGHRLAEKMVQSLVERKGHMLVDQTESLMADLKGE